MDEKPEENGKKNRRKFQKTKGNGKKCINGPKMAYNKSYNIVATVAWLRKLCNDATVGCK